MAVLGYSLPSVHVMRNVLIPARYAKVKQLIKDKLSACTAITIILDIWSSKSMVGYIGFTCSGVLKTFEPFRCFLAIRKMVEKHTGEAIISEYEDVLEEWGIPISKVKIFNIKLYNVSWSQASQLILFWFIRLFGSSQMVVKI